MKFIFRLRENERPTLDPKSVSVDTELKVLIDIRYSAENFTPKSQDTQNKDSLRIRTMRKHLRSWGA